MIVYYSLSGNTGAFAKRFEKDGFTVLSIREADLMNKPFVLFTPTYNFGEVPAPVERFLNRKAADIRAVVSFGNMNWGENYAAAGEKIRDRYGVPLLLKVELRGSSREYEKVKELLSDWRN